MMSKKIYIVGINKDFMKNRDYIYFIAILSILIYIPHLSFGQINNITKANNSLTNTSQIDLSGQYLSNKLDKYYLKQIGNSLWWIGFDKNNSTLNNIFKGVVVGNNIVGQWIDSPLKNMIKNGTLTMKINPGLNNTLTINKVPFDNNYSINQLTKISPESKTISKFMVVIDNINVKIPRSPVFDVIFVGLSVKKGNNEPLTSTQFLASREKNDNISLYLSVGPLEINHSDKGITIEFLGVNKNDASVSSMLINLEEALIQLSDTSFNTYDISNANQADSALKSIFPGLLSTNCNGLIFSDKIFIPIQDLKKILSSGTYSQEKTYLGTITSPGCGPISKYEVKWSIIPIQ